MKRRAALLIAIATLVALAFALLRKKEPQVLWSRDTASAWPNAPAIGRDGTLYFGDFEGNLTAISSNGTELWRTNLCLNARAGAAFVTGATIGSDGSIYVVGGDGRVCAVSAKGELRWSKSTNANPYGHISIDPQDNLYVIGISRLHAFTSEGIERWCFQADGPLNGSSVIGRDGTIYTSSQGTNFYAFDEYGNVKWRWTTPGYISPSLIAGTNGSIYVAAYSTLNALNDDGSLRWTITNVTVTSLLLLDGEGRLYCTTLDGILTVDTAAGKSLWTRDIAEISHGMATAALGRDGCVYVSADTGTLYAIESITGKVRWTFTRRPRHILLQRIGEWINFAFGGFSRRGRAIYPCAFTLSEERVLYAVMPDRKVYALAVPAGLVTNAPWPMSQHDVRHTSSLSSPAGQ